MNFKEWLLLTEKIVHNGKNYETVMDLLKHLENEPNTYISFQMYPQLEIWPKQHKIYDTPVGIYAYPIKYASEKLEKLPFATQKPYLIIFKPTGNIISNNLTEQEQDNYLEKLKQLYPTADLEKVNDYEIHSPFSKLWLAVVMIIAPDNPSKQNKIFRQLGINGFNDKGSGTIHPEEKYQAVFFKPQTLQKIQILDNVLHKSLLGKQPLQKYPKEIIANATPDQNAIEKYTNYIMRNNKFKDNTELILSNSIEPDKTAKLIIKNKKNLSDDDINHLLDYTTDKEKIAKLIINKKDLSYDSVNHLLDYATDKDKIAKLIVKNKKDLNDANVYYLLRYAKNKDEIAEMLGQNNINKLSDENVRYLLIWAPNPDEIRSLLQKYGRIQ
jgi:hypothetical protein